MITIENDEMGHGLDASIELEKDRLLALDIHHWICRNEEYIDPNDDRVKRALDSWRGQRPTLHYLSRDEALALLTWAIRYNEMHDIKKLLELGCKKQKLRAQRSLSNAKANDWALSFGENFDIQAEAKGNQHRTVVRAVIALLAHYC